MASFRLNDGDNFFEMDVEKVIKRHVNECDVKLKASLSGFQGVANTSVEVRDIKDSCKSLSELDRTLRGEAKVASLISDGSRIRIFAATPRGHLAVEGEISRWIKNRNDSYLQSLSFGFEFENMELARALRADWVQHYIELKR